MKWKYSMPFQVGWDIVHECNFRCKHCYFSSEQLSDPRAFSLDEAFRFVDSLVIGKVFHLSIAGGEPLLYPHLIEVVRRATHGGISVAISTNASLLTSEMASALANAGAKSLQISLEGPSREINDQIRGKGSFDKTLRGIANAQLNNLKVWLAIVLVKPNISAVDEYLQLAERLKVSGVKVQTIVKSGLGARNADDLIVPVSEVINILSGLWRAKLERRYPFDLVLPMINGVEGISPSSGSCTGCKPGIQTIRVSAHGSVRACGSDVNSPSLGNVRLEELRDIWCNSVQLNEIRKADTISAGASTTSCGVTGGNVCKSRAALQIHDQSNH